MTLAWFQVLGFLQISHSKFPLVPKYQLLGMLRKVWMLLVQGSWQLRHQDLWKGCCHSAYWLIWSICWHYWFKLFLYHLLPATHLVFVVKKKPQTTKIFPHWHLLLVSSSEGGVSCGWRGKQEGMGTAWAAPNHGLLRSSVLAQDPHAEGALASKLGL